MSNLSSNWADPIMNITVAKDEEVTEGHPLSFYLIIIAGVTLSTMTNIGNIMVMLSFKIDRNLQSVTNYFLFSLAVADMSIGLISIPFMTYYTAVGSWNIGYTACQFWLCMDYLMSNASVMNLVLISIDRYFSVTRPLTYRPKRTKNKALMMIASTYIISALLWPPWIIGWPYIDGKFTEPDGSCYIQFLETSPIITFITACCAFYIPILVMTFLYMRVYAVAKRRTKVFGTTFKESKKITGGQSVKSTGNQSDVVTTHQDDGEVEKKRKARRPENKAARTLLAITLAFFITWLPYDILVLWEHFNPHSTPAWLWSFSYALCYVNSTLNPICYALGNPRYRKTYLQIIKCQWGKRNSSVDWRRSTIDEKI
ncbi:unnamed protein product [Auanema sp. JU1783]|nr:unnamed protein product [Auanema sp. JU1783]